MIVETPFGVAPTWTEAHELLKKNGVQANEENFRPVQVELDVCRDGKIVRRKNAGEVVDELNNILKKHYRELYDKMDYGFSQTFKMGREADRLSPLPDQIRWIAIYAVRGTSEGWYVHVDAIRSEDTRETLFLAKTFCGRAFAYELAAVCAELFDA